MYIFLGYHNMALERSADSKDDLIPSQDGIFWREE